MSDITVAIDTILDRRDGYDTAAAYYEGDVDEKVLVTSAPLRKIFSHHGNDYLLDFSGVVVDSVLNRLEIANIIGGNERANEIIGRVWDQNELDLEANEIHKRALEFGDCYALVWPDENGEILISYNSPQNSVLIYDPENPRKKLFGAKYWEIPADKREQMPKGLRLTLYYADRIVKYTAPYTPNIESAQWEVLETVENPFGEVPMFHFRTARPYGRPEHKSAYTPQNIINKLTITHMYTVDYQGASQRYALSAGQNSSEMDDFAEGETERENVQGLKSGPGELWYLKGVTQVGEFKAADPDTFLKPVIAAIRMMASMTHTPLHYFEKTGNVPSGEALRTAEAPLVKKVKDRQFAFGSVWREIFKFCLKIEKLTGVDVQVKWVEVESTDVQTQWEIALLKRTAGVPFRQVMREMGYDDDVIDAMEEEIEKNGGAGQFDPSTGMNAHNLALQQAKKEKEAQQNRQGSDEPAS